MDEILASIRRIIESSEEKPGSFAASSAARVAVSGRATTAREALVERLATIELPTQAARVVPFSERAPFAPKADFDDVDERWMPVTEPANQPDHTQARQIAADEATSEAAEQPVDPVASADRWTQEFDDVESWTVLDKASAPAPAVSGSLETKTLGEAEDRDGGALARVSKPDALVDAVDVNEVLPEPETLASAAGTRSEGEAMASASKLLDAIEPPADVAPENEDDFLVDFNEADFVEALDRNAAFATAPRDAAAASVETAEMRPDVDAAEPVKTPFFLRQRSAPGEDAAPIFPAAAKPELAAAAASVMQETSALMSDQAGSEVAAAFDDLARAIRDGQMKSMEEMAREMLRPMLQDWLDDNLPRLVERLVRDEIERVSRGVRN